jgi:hypothetical protein
VKNEMPVPRPVWQVRQMTASSLLPAKQNSIHWHPLASQGKKKDLNRPLLGVLLTLYISRVSL